MMCVHYFLFMLHIHIQFFFMQISSSRLKEQVWHVFIITFLNTLHFVNSTFFVFFYFNFVVILFLSWIFFCFCFDIVCFICKLKEQVQHFFIVPSLTLENFGALHFFLSFISILSSTCFYLRAFFFYKFHKKLASSSSMHSSSLKLFQAL